MDIVMALYNLIEYSDKYSKKSGSLWYYYKDELFLNDNGVISNFPADNCNNSASFKLKTKITGSTGNDGTKTLKLEYH